MAEHSLNEVTRIKTEVEDGLLALPGVTGVDAGYRGGAGDPVIRVYVTSRDELPPELANLTDIRGVPVELIERRFEPH